MKIYIAGKYTGLLHHEAVAKFAATKRKLTDAGIAEKDILNPMEFGINQETDWHCAMDVCLEKLGTCTAIYIQRDWRDSFGARREINRACELHLDMYWEEQNDIAMLTNLIATGV